MVTRILIIGTTGKLYETLPTCSRVAGCRLLLRLWHEQLWTERLTEVPIRLETE